MSWGPDFLRRLRRDKVDPLFLVESVAVGAFVVEGARELRLSSFSCTGYVECLAPQSSSVSHGELTLPGFQRSGSTVSLALTRDVGRDLTRGLVVALRMGFTGWAPGEFATVFLGQVRSWRYSSGRWTLTLQDLASGLASTFSAAAAVNSRTGLFDGLSDTTLTSAYTVGDTSIDVTSTVGFEREDSGLYGLVVTPDSGEPFFLFASGKTSTTFTGLTTGSLLGTTLANAAAGSTVAEVAYTETHPLNVIRRILVSTGTANLHGSRDLLPQAWGYGCPPHLVAGDDIQAHVLLSSPSSGANDWVLAETQRQDSGLSWMQQWLAPGGMFVGVRQGELTARCVVDPDTTETPDEHEITDAEISTVEYSAWDEQQPVEYRYLRVEDVEGTSTTSTEDTIATRPVGYERRLLLADAWDNLSGWRSEVSGRLARLLLRAPERLTVTCAGLDLAAATPGDAVRLSTGLVRSRYDAEGGRLLNRRVLVVGGGPDWFRGTVQLRLLAVPPIPGGTL